MSPESQADFLYAPAPSGRPPTPRVFVRPTPTEKALEFCETLREQPNAVVLAPGPRQWEVFTRLCRATGAKENLVPGPYLGALAIESGSEW